MKTSENSLVILTVTFFFASLSLSGCDFSAAEDALSNFDVIISLEEVNSYVALTVVDGQTGNFVQQQVNLAFFGQDSDAVIDMFSDPVADLSVSGGIGSFGIRNALVPSDSNPIEVRVQVEAQLIDKHAILPSACAGSAKGDGEAHDSAQNQEGKEEIHLASLW